MTKLEQLRRERGWSRSELSHRAKLTGSVLNLIETRRFIPYAVQLQRIADALDAEARTLLDEVE